jgi:hypothetical protein
MDRMIETLGNMYCEYQSSIATNKTVNNFKIITIIIIIIIIRLQLWYIC